MATQGKAEKEKVIATVQLDSAFAAVLQQDDSVDASAWVRRGFAPVTVEVDGHEVAIGKAQFYFGPDDETRAHIRTNFNAWARLVGNPDGLPRAAYAGPYKVIGAVGAVTFSSPQ